MNIYDIFNGKKQPKQSTVSESRIEIIHEFAEPEPGDSGESGVPEQVHQLANRWWNYADPEDQEKIEAVLRSLGWTISQVESEDDAVQLQYRDGSVEFISADEFDPDMHEDTDQFSSAGLNGVAATQDSDNVASPVGSGVAEGSNDGKEDNFTIDDIKNLEKIRDFETLKAHAKELIKGKPARRMKPEKISWFYNHIDTLKNPLAVIKMMYDLMLAGEGHKVIGSRNSMSSNSYRTKFGEQGVAEDTGSWIVYDPETKQIRKRFKTHTAGKSYAQTHGLGFASSEYYFDQVKEKTVAEDAGPSPVAGAITRRILQQRLDLLKQYGPDLVGAAVDNVADYVGDVDEIGSSDVSAWVAQVERMLQDNPPEAFSEAGNPAQQAAIAIAKKKEQGVAETAPLTRDTRRELVAPTDRDRIRRELWKYVRSLDQEGMSNRAHAMAHSCPTWGRLYHQFNDDVSQLLSKAPTELLAQALREIQSKFQGVTEADYEIHHHDPEGRLKARYHHGSEYTDDVIRKDADYHQKRNPKDTIKVFKDKKPMESQGVEEGYVDFHGNRENTPQIVWWRKPAGDNIYWKVFPTLSMASRATTNLANSLYKKYGKYLETGNVNFDPTNSAHCRAIDANKYMTESIKQKIQELEEHIGKVKSGYRLYSHTGKNLGTFPNKAGAKKHEREVQYFKHASEGIDEGSQSFHNGMQVKLTPEYADRPDEIFTVSHCDQERGRCWIGDEQGRGWSATFDQLIPVEDDDDDELDINENYLHQLKLAGYEIL